MSRRITDDEPSRLIMEALRRYEPFTPIPTDWLVAILGWPVTRRLRALRDEGRVVEVPGPRGSLWRLP